MTQPIFETKFWQERLGQAVARGEVHRAIFECHLSLWEQITNRHKYILSNRFFGRPKDSVLDLGCGWGRLLSLMPENWEGDYLGIDLSPEFLALARAAYKDRMFLQLDLRRYGTTGMERIYDWAVLVSIRDMLLSDAGGEVWEKVEANLKKCCRRILILEYSETDQGEIIEGEVT
jgi:SAM-dependent methyltransferase